MPHEMRHRRAIRTRGCGSGSTATVLGPLVEQQGEPCARAISEWRDADSVWQRRASVVAFANLARKGDQNLPGLTEMVLDNCSHLLGSQERFAQTGVGWVLREHSRSD